MGLPELQDKLRREAQREKEDILEEARQEAEEIKGEYQSEIDEAYQDTLEKKLRQADSEATGIVGRARVESNHMVSNAKKEVLEEVYDRALKKVRGLPDEEKKKLLDRWVCEGEVLDEAVVKVKPEYSHLIDAGGFEVVEEDIGDFGVVVENPEGSIRLDMRLESVLDSVKPELKSRLNKTLWGDR